MIIIHVPNPALQAINKPYMNSIQCSHINGDLHEGQAMVSQLHELNIFLSVSVFFQMLPNQNTLNVLKLKISFL